MRLIFAFCIFLSLNIPMSVSGQEPEELRKLSREVEVLRKQGLSHIKLIENVYDREKDEADNIFQNEVAKRRNETLTKLNAEIDSSMEAKQLDKAIKLKELVEKVKKQEFGNLEKSAPIIKPQAKPKVKKSKVNEPSPTLAILIGSWMSCTVGAKTNVVTLYKDGTWTSVYQIYSGRKWSFSRTTNVLVLTRPGWRETYKLSTDGKLASGQNNRTGIKVWLVKLDDQ